MRAIIIDDDRINIEILEKFISEYCEGVTVVANASDVSDGISIIREFKPDLVFLDIEIPEGNAFFLLDQLLPIDFEVIFVSAFDKYSLNAIRYSALDYLLKPINIKELQKAVANAKNRLSLKTINQQLANLYKILRANDKNAPLTVALPLKDGYEFVKTTDIIYFHSANNYTHAFCTNNKKYLSAKSLSEYEDLLAESNFFRAHHSFLINMGFIKQFKKEGRGGIIEMHNGAKILVSYRRKDEFLSRFR